MAVGGCKGKLSQGAGVARQLPICEHRVRRVEVDLQGGEGYRYLATIAAALEVGDVLQLRLVLAVAACAITIDSNVVVVRGIASRWTGGRRDDGFDEVKPWKRTHA